MGYQHTQTAPLYLLLMAIGVALVVGAVFSPIVEAQVAMSLAGAAVLVLAFGFRHLTIVDEDDRLVAQFGPLPIFRRTVSYDQVERVKPSRSTWIDGWGIHYAPGKAIWNLWGFGCVDIYFKNGKMLRLGTDEPQVLAEFLGRRIKQPSR